MFDNTQRIIANCFSLASASFLAYSTFSKKKEKMLIYQSFDVFFCFLADVFVGSYSAAVTCIINLARNMLAAKNKLKIWMSVVCVILTIVLGVLCNQIGFVGWLPIFASVEYTFAINVTKNANEMRYALILNLILWLMHDLYVGLCPNAIMDCVIVVFSVFNIIRLKKID